MPTGESELRHRTDLAGRVVIAETATSMWNYHLRKVEDGKLYLGGGAPPALCGRKLGWDTKIPLTAWGTKSHIPQSWCKECERLSDSV
jgi:hypothetical protein